MTQQNKMLGILGLAFCLFQSGLAGAVQVKAVDGTLFEAGAKEIKAAYLQSLQDQFSRNADSFVNNEDGSVTAVHPRFNYNGKDYPIHTDFYDYYAGIYVQGQGVCALFGFTDWAFTESKPTKQAPAIELNRDGSLHGLVTTKVNVMENITCRK